MKRITLLMTATLCSCLLLSSCNRDDNEETPQPLREETLAESIDSPSMINFKAEGSYDGTPLEDLQTGQVDFEAESDTTIRLYCLTYWKDQSDYIISIPSIPLSGVPGSVAFDYTCDDALVYFYDKEYSRIRSSIKSWIKRDDFKDTSSSTRLSPNPPPTYACDITLECTIDGKVLHQRIVADKFY